MPQYIRIILHLEYMDLMSPLLPALSQVSSPLDSEFSEILIAQLHEFPANGIDTREVFHNRHDVDYRLGSQKGYGCALYMMD